MPDIDVERALGDLRRDGAPLESGSVPATAPELRRRGDRRRRIAFGVNMIGALTAIALFAGAAVFLVSGRPVAVPNPAVSPSPSPTPSPSATVLRLAPLDGYADGTVLVPPTQGRGTQDLGPLRLPAGKRLRVYFTCLPFGHITLSLDKELLVGGGCGYPKDVTTADGLSSVGGVSLPVPDGRGAVRAPHLIVSAGPDVTWALVVQLDP